VLPKELVEGGGATEQFGKCLTVAFAEKSYFFVI